MSASSLLRSRPSSPLQNDRCSSKSFFAVFIVVSAVAELPLDMVGHAASRYYGISVQGWGGWFLDQAKGLGLSLLGVFVLLLFNWIVRRWPRRYWFGVWLV